MKLFVILAFLINTNYAISQTNESYIMLGYTSICCGTPTKKQVINYIKNFETQNKLLPFEIFIENGLGKEGEFAFYIGTDNLINTKLLNLFMNGLKITATEQNKQRSKNGGGFVNVYEKLIQKAILKSIKIKPRNRISSIKIFDYKK